MAVTDLHAALTIVKGALPALETLATADARRADLDTTIARLNAEVTTLTAQRVAIQTQLVEGTKAADVVREKQAKDYAVSINFAEEKIKDLQRSQQTAENALAATRAEHQRLRDQYLGEREQTLVDHRTNLAGLIKQEQEAAARLAETQEKIKALHGDLAGLSTP